jgi:CrcB protein
VGLGGAIGALGRHGIGTWTKTSLQSFPWPTLLINFVGSAALGVFTAAALARGWGMHERLFFAVGVCGGFTTFSTFSIQVIELVYERSWRSASTYIALSLMLCIGGCFLGGHFGRLLFSKHSPGNPFG